MAGKQNLLSFKNRKIRVIKSIIIFSVWLSFSLTFSQEKVLYKTVDSAKLFMKVYYPKDMNPEKNYPAMVFYFGGGWQKGSIDQFKPQAQYFAQRGMVCFLVDYRVEKRQGTTPFESLKDAKTAMRFIRKNALKFHINPSQIVGSGGSAGGHLAAAAALVEGYNEITDDVSINCKPNALVLFNPVLDNGPSGYGYARIGKEYVHFSPLHNIKKDAPSTLIFLGTKDHLIPVVTMEDYKDKMIEVGSRCELVLFKGQGHGFFNYKNFKNYKETILKTDAFLVSLGYLDDTPKITIE